MIMCVECAEKLALPDGILDDYDDAICSKDCLAHWAARYELSGWDPTVFETTPLNRYPDWGYRAMALPHRGRPRWVVMAVDVP